MHTNIAHKSDKFIKKIKGKKKKSYVMHYAYINAHILLHQAQWKYRMRDDALKRNKIAYKIKTNKIQYSSRSANNLSATNIAYCEQVKDKLRFYARLYYYRYAIYETIDKLDTTGDELNYFK